MDKLCFVLVDLIKIEARDYNASISVGMCASGKLWTGDKCSMKFECVIPTAAKDNTVGKVS